MAAKLSREEQKSKYVTGNYRDLKEFSERETINYAYLRKYAASDKWNETKKEHEEQIAHTIVTNDMKSRVKTAIERQNATLNLCEKLRKKIEDCADKEKPNANELNALASAVYRLKEVESDLLNYKSGTTDSARSRLDAVVEAIRGKTVR